MRLRNWIIFTSLGWLAGIPLLITLAGVLEPIGLEKTPIALGMSIAIGTLQWLQLRKRLPSSTRWIAISAVGFTIPFVMVDVLGEHWFESTEAGIIASTVVGSISMALAQHRFLLRSVGVGLMAWIVVNIMAYCLALMPPFLLSVTRINQLHLPGALSVALSFLTVLAGGPIIGYLTGTVLVRTMNIGGALDKNRESRS